jgi:hypothetical protein
MACLPQNWDGIKRNRAAEIQGPEKRQKQASVDSNLVRNVLRDLAGTSVARNLSDTLSHELIMESMPFGKILENIPAEVKTAVPVITRAYEEQYMREVINSTEEACSMGVNCECMLLDKSDPFVGVAFPIPVATGSPNALCILCLRKITQLLFFYVVDQGMHVDRLIQRHANICGEPGEYSTSAVLICPPHGPVSCMPLPVVAHQRNRYSVERKAGIAYIKQRGVYFEDF